MEGLRWKACLDVLGPETRMAYRIRCLLDTQGLSRQTAPVYVVYATRTPETLLIDTRVNFTGQKRLLKIFKGADFRVDVPPQPRTAAQIAQATDAGLGRSTAARKDRLQNERDQVGLAELRSAWNAVPNLRSDDEARDLLGVPNPAAARGAGRLAQYGATFE